MRTIAAKKIAGILFHQRATEYCRFADQRDFSTPSSVEMDGWGVFEVEMNGWGVFEVEMTVGVCFEVEMNGWGVFEV
jgi:hypothetical protein